MFRAFSVSGRVGKGSLAFLKAIGVPVDVDRQQMFIKECVNRVLEPEEDLELVEVAVSGKGRNAILRVYIYKPSGVTIEDCVRVNRRLSRELEYEPELESHFSIEVSSPGLDRRLHTRRDYERAVGEMLCLMVAGGEGEARTVRGRLTEVEEETLLLDPPSTKRSGKGKRNPAGDPIRVPLEAIREGKIEIIL